MRIAFFGTGDFSKNILSKFLEYKDVEVCLVVSQPDKLVGRKKILEPTPIKLLAKKNNIRVLQPDKLKGNTRFFEELKNLDFIVVVAYGKIVPVEVLNSPKYGCINIHGSILPLYRGASPIQESIKLGDKETGLTIMYMSEGMDEGDILNIEKVKIENTDKTQDIFDKFESIGPKLLYSTLSDILNKKITGISQKNEEATYCSKISKSDGEVIFSKLKAEEVYNIFRAYSNWPGIYTYYNSKKLQIDSCELLDSKYNGEVGRVVLCENKKIGIVCMDKKIVILNQVKLEGKKSMDIKSFVNGNKAFLNYKLS